MKRFGFGNLLSVLVLVLLGTGVLLTVQQTKQQQREGRALAHSDHCLDNSVHPFGGTWAFCDTFAQGSPGGRGGELDERLWSFVRVNGSTNLSQGQVNIWWPTMRAFCSQQSLDGPVLPPSDSFFCGPNVNPGESMHWMEAYDDRGALMFNSARIRQPFDFANRTGVITYDVDANATGHGYWHQVAITDQPMPGPYQDVGVLASEPRNGVIIVWDHCLQSPDLGVPDSSQVAEIRVFRNYSQEFHGAGEIADSVPGHCVVTELDRHNRIEIRMSTDKIEMWASDRSPDHMMIPNFHKIAEASNLNLPFTRGYINFQHGQYNAAKGTVFHAAEGFHTYHWDNMGFDGPKLPTPRGYDVQDSMQSWRGEGVSLGYVMRPTGLRMPDDTALPNGLTVTGVDLSDATEAILNFMVQQENGHNSIDYSLNGGSWHSFSYPFNHSNGGSGHPSFSGWSIPVALSELRNGTNTINFRISLNDYTGSLVLANVDITINPGDMLDGNPMPTIGMSPTGMTPTSTPTPTRTPTPTVTPTRTPTSTASKPGDADDDGDVDVTDLSVLASTYTSTTDLRADFNGDGIVKIEDLAILASNYGG